MRQHIISLNMCVHSKYVAVKVISLLFSNKQQLFFYYIRASDFVIQNKISICIIFFVASEATDVQSYVECY